MLLNRVIRLGESSLLISCLIQVGKSCSSNTCSLLDAGDDVGPALEDGGYPLRIERLGHCDAANGNYGQKDRRCKGRRFADGRETSRG